MDKSKIQETLPMRTSSLIAIGFVLSTITLLGISVFSFSAQSVYAQVPEDSVITPIQGYRIQVFTGEDEKEARAFYGHLRFSLDEEVYLSHENGKWRVRVGDFVDVPSAEKTLKKLEANKMTGMTMVQDTMMPPLDGFRVQIASLKTRSTAAGYARMVEGEFKVRAHIIKVGDFWKVRAGDFSGKEQAESLMNQLIDRGHNEAKVIRDKIVKSLTD